MDMQPACVWNPRAAPIASGMGMCEGRGGANPLLEFDWELHALVQLVQASSSICEPAHV